MLVEIPTLLVVMLGAASTVLVGTVALASSRRTPASRPFRRDPMDWHPGRFFPPALIRQYRGGEPSVQSGRKAA